MFDLVEGDDLHCDPYYVFLTRTRNFYFTWRSVHAGSRLDLLGKAEIVDAARQLAAPEVRIL